jgi:hypothetical protein
MYMRDRDGRQGMRGYFLHLTPPLHYFSGSES